MMGNYGAYSVQKKEVVLQPTALNLINRKKMKKKVRCKYSILIITGSWTELRLRKYF